MANYKLVNADQLDSDLTKVGNAIRTKGGTTKSLSFPNEMVSAIDAISTGVELNFEVVGGTSQPSNPKENTIWVNTSTGITGWIMDANQPEELTEGMVWISVGTSSAVEFNALRKNGIQVYPLSAKQMVDSALVEVEAMSYQGGKWVNWIVYLLNGSDINEEVTGGWRIENGGNIVATLTENGVVFSSPGGISANAVIYTNNKIDVTNFTKISIDEIICTGWKDGNTSNSYFYFGLVSEVFGDYIYPHDWVCVTTLNGAGEWYDQYVDISAISGEYYVAICMDVGLGSANGVKLM